VKTREVKEGRKRRTMPNRNEKRRSQKKRNKLKKHSYNHLFKASFSCLSKWPEGRKGGRKLRGLKQGTKEGRKIRGRNIGRNI
jgi:hypothetical protein